MTPQGFHYATRQAIRKESGRQHRKSAERPSGVVNANNKDFYVAKKYVVDRNDDDIFNANDVVAYVDGVAVAVAAVNADNGLISLQVAPANGTVVTADYQFSELSDADIDEVRTEAEGWLTGRVKGYIDVTVFVQASLPGADPIVLANYPKTFSTIVKLYAAALILIRDYGSGADTDLTSKDGYKKLGVAKSMLSDWLAEFIEDNGSGTKTGRATVRTDGNIFNRSRDLGSDKPDQDDMFMRKR